MAYLDFEKPIAEVQDQLTKLRQVGEEGKIDITASEEELEAKLASLRKEIYANLTGWQKVQLSPSPRSSLLTLLYREPLRETSSSCTEIET